MHDGIKQPDEQIELLIDDLNIFAIRQHFDVFRTIFKEFSKKEKNSEKSQYVRVSPTVTPASSYLTTILLHFETNPNLAVN